MSQGELNQNLAGNEIYSKVCSLLVILNNSSGKLHCQKSSNSIPFSNQIRGERACSSKSSRARASARCGVSQMNCHSSIPVSKVWRVAGVSKVRRVVYTASARRWRQQSVSKASARRQQGGSVSKVRRFTDELPLRHSCARERVSSSLRTYWSESTSSS